MTIPTLPLTADRFVDNIQANRQARLDLFKFLTSEDWAHVTALSFALAGRGFTSPPPSSSSQRKAIASEWSAEGCS